MVHLVWDLSEKPLAVKFAFLANHYLGNFGHGFTRIEADTYTLKLKLHYISSFRRIVQRK